jgi:fructose-1,6-bisphosphatase/inositol monophosphatase family enzyme
MVGQIMSRPFTPEGQEALRAKGIVFHRDPAGLRCAGQEYFRLVRGQWHFTAYGRLRPWDHCAGVVIHGEAGGFSAYLDNRAAYHVARGDHALMMAPSIEAWDALRADWQRYLKTGIAL